MDHRNVCWSVWLFFYFTGIPDLVIYSRNCPVGSGVVGNYIKTGTSATCKCEVENHESSGGQAQWFTADGRQVGVDNPTDGSSTLTMAYSASS